MKTRRTVTMATVPLLLLLVSAAAATPMDRLMTAIPLRDATSSSEASPDLSRFEEAPAAPATAVNVTKVVAPPVPQEIRLAFSEDLCVTAGTALATTSMPMVLDICANSSNQIWTLRADGTVRLDSNDRYCVTVQGGKLPTLPAATNTGIVPPKANTTSNSTTKAAPPAPAPVAVLQLDFCPPTLGVAQKWTNANGYLKPASSKDLCWEVRDGRFAKSATLVLTKCTQKPRQRFAVKAFAAKRVVPNTQQLRVRLMQHLCLWVQNTNANAPLMLQTCTRDAPNLRWRRYADGSVRFASLPSMCLQLAAITGNATISEGLSVVLNACSDEPTTKQKWTVDKEGQFHSAFNKTFVWDVQGASYAPNSRIVMFKSVAHLGKQMFMGVAPEAAPDIPVTQSIRFRKADKFCLTLPDGKLVNEARIGIYTCKNNTAAQQWRIYPDRTIRYQADLRWCITARSAAPADSDWTVLMPCTTPSPNQQWVFNQTLGTIATALDKKFVMDLSGGRQTDGTAVNLWHYNKTMTSQSWNFASEKAKVDISKKWGQDSAINQALEMFLNQTTAVADLAARQKGADNAKGKAIGTLAVGWAIAKVMKEMSLTDEGAAASGDKKDVRAAVAQALFKAQNTNSASQDKINADAMAALKKAVSDLRQRKETDVTRMKKLGPRHYRTLLRRFLPDTSIQLVQETRLYPGRTAELKLKHEKELEAAAQKLSQIEDADVKKWLNVTSRIAVPDPNAIANAAQTGTGSGSSTTTTTTPL